MTTPNKLNEFNHAEDPARRLLERLGWTYVPAEQLASERATERDVLLKDRVRAALLRLNDGMTGAQAERVIYDLVRADGHRDAAQPTGPRVPDLRHDAHRGRP